MLFFSLSALRFKVIDGDIWPAFLCIVSIALPTVKSCSLPRLGDWDWLSVMAGTAARRIPSSRSWSPALAEDVPNRCFKNYYRQTR